MKEQLTRAHVMEGIAKSALYGNLGLFLGSGFSIGVMEHFLGNPALTWGELLKSIAVDFEIDFEKDLINGNPGASYPRIVTILIKIIAEKQGKSFDHATLELKQKIADKTSWIPDKTVRKEYGDLILGIKPKWIITTNYDLVIESLLFTKGESISAENQIFIATDGKIPIYHLHGIRTLPNSIIISDGDYIKLFRPNSYRQLKLPLLIKESTTLLIGYNLNDINVLTAVDWSKNVYQESSNNYPSNIYQLLHISDHSQMKHEPYLNENGIVILEFNELNSILNEIAEIVKKARIKRKNDDKKYKELESEISELSDQKVSAIVSDENRQIELFKILFELEVAPDSLLFVLYQKLMDESWKQSSVNYAFDAYNYNLIIHLNIFNHLTEISISPVLIEMFAYNLNKLASYIGNNLGQSHAAYYTWNKRNLEIPKEILFELFKISESMNFYNLNRLLKPIINQFEKDK
jgi:hypothetical protein